MTVQSMSICDTSYRNGIQCSQIGKSRDYNPYRNKEGHYKESMSWILGWQNAHEAELQKQNQSLLYGVTIEVEGKPLKYRFYSQATRNDFLLSLVEYPEMKVVEFFSPVL